MPSPPPTHRPATHSGIDNPGFDITDGEDSLQNGVHPEHVIAQFEPDTPVSGSDVTGSERTGTAVTPEMDITEKQGTVARNRNSPPPDYGASWSRDDDVTDDVDTQCGVGGSRASCCEIFNNPKWVLVFLSWFAFIQGFVVNGINNVNTSPLERRFELTSSKAGLISSAYDISAAILVIPISYFGAYAHQPRMLSMAAFVMSLGSFIMALPHFTTPAYQLKDTSAGQCVAPTATNMTYSQCGEVNPGNQELQHYLGVFMLGMILHGVGGTTLYTIGIVFIDTNVSSRNSPLYTGVMYGMAALGPAVGYLLGGYLVGAVYVDADVFDATSLSLTQADPRWVGAWWIGFLISGSLFLTAFLCLLPYPRQLPTFKAVQAERFSQTHNNGSEAVASRSGFGMSYKDLPTSFRLLVSNPVYMFVTLSGVTEGLVTGGIATFLPKFIQNQFGVSAGLASILGGAMAVPGAAGGQFAGGVIAKLGKLRVKALLRLNMGFSVGTLAICTIFLARCGLTSIAGVNVDYSAPYDPLLPRDVNLSSSCNAACGCTTLSYEPVCGSNGIEYFSACHAGCTSRTPANVTGTVTVYDSCSCVPPMPWVPGNATDGLCPRDCSDLYIFLPFFFLLIFMTFVMAVPALNITLRCIPDCQRSFGLGVQWVFIRVLGTVPGPILFGAIFDSTCLVWQERCDQSSGSCWLYDNWNLSVRVMIITMCIKLCSLILFLCAHFTYKPPPEDVTASKGELSDSDTGSREMVDGLGYGERHSQEGGTGVVGTGHTTGVENPALDMDETL